MAGKHQKSKHRGHAHTPSSPTTSQLRKRRDSAAEACVMNHFVPERPPSREKACHITSSTPPRPPNRRNVLEISLQQIVPDATSCHQTAPRRGMQFTANGGQASPEGGALARPPLTPSLRWPISAPVLAPGKGFRRPAPGFGTAHMSLLVLAVSWSCASEEVASMRSQWEKPIVVAWTPSHWVSGTCASPRSLSVPGMGHAPGQPPRLPDSVTELGPAGCAEANGMAHVKLPSRFLYRAVGTGTTQQPGVAGFILRID